MAQNLQLAGSGLDQEAPVIRVVLADDHRLMRASLRRLLDEERDLHVIAETDDVREAVEYVHRSHPQVLVLDLSMPTGSSIDAIRQIREHMPETQVVVLQMQASAAYARHALAAGALGYVLKDTADSELIEAVHRAAHGETFVSPRVAPALGGELAGC